MAKVGLGAPTRTKGAKYEADDLAAYREKLYAGIGPSAVSHQLPSASPDTPASAPEADTRKQQIIDAFAELQKKVKAETFAKAVAQQELQAATRAGAISTDSFQLAQQLELRNEELKKRNARIQAITESNTVLEAQYLQHEEAKVQLQEDYRRVVEDYRRSSHKCSVLDSRLEEAVCSLQKAEEENASLNERMDALRAVNHK